MGFELLKILCFWSVVIIVAGVLTRWALKQASRLDWVPIPNSRLRLRQGASIFHCNFLEATKKGWKVSAPISQSDVVPLRPSELFMVDFTTDNGVGTFFTQVLYRENGTVPSLTLKAPTKVRFVDRRFSARLPISKKALTNSEQECEILDIGEGGAKIQSASWMQPGDPIRIERASEMFEGWVLACEPAPLSKSGFRTRVRFKNETPLERIVSISASPDG